MEVAIGLAMAAVASFVRLPLIPIIGERAPYAFVFVAIVLAAVLAGWRSGLVALVAGQLLAAFMLVEPVWTLALADRERLGAFVTAMVSEALILLVIALYQREVAMAAVERETRMDLLSEALREIDHRTKNNYQTVLALVQLQAQRAREPEVKHALQQVADRIQAVNLATQHLALRSEDLGTVRLADHLCELCEQVERGLSRDGVHVRCDVENLNASTEKAIYLSIIVNELVTNALKHAFKDAGTGVIRVASQVKGENVAIIVEDNGCGMKAAGKSRHGGLGSRLVERFARQLDARHEVVSSEAGTVHRLVLASLI